MDFRKRDFKSREKVIFLQTGDFRKVIIFLLILPPL